jgi:hypothetical protein
MLQAAKFDLGRFGLTSQPQGVAQLAKRAAQISYRLIACCVGSGAELNFEFFNLWPQRHSSHILPLVK